MWWYDCSQLRVNSRIILVDDGLGLDFRYSSNAILSWISWFLKFAISSFCFFSFWVGRLFTFPEGRERWRSSWPHFEQRLLVHEEELLQRLSMGTLDIYHGLELYVYHRVEPGTLPLAGLLYHVTAGRCLLSGYPLQFIVRG